MLFRSVRYLYLVPEKKGDNKPPGNKVAITGLYGNYQARLLGNEQALTVTTDNDTITVAVPADVSGGSVRVVKLFPQAK